MIIFLTATHILVCVILIVVVLLQRGKGAELGAVFGGGASTTVFGSRGAGNFLTRLTTAAAILFMTTSLWLAILANRSVTESLFEEEPTAAEQPAEAAGFEELPAPEAEGGFVELEPAPAGEAEAPPAEPPAAPSPAAEGGTAPAAP